MCNPPFYASPQEISQKKRLKLSSSASSSAYTDGESVYPGGEVAFISSMIEASLLYQTRIYWYTSLVGIKSSLRPLLDILQSHKAVSEAKVIPICRGQTKRWILAWTFIRRLDLFKCPSLVLSSLKDLGIDERDGLFYCQERKWGRKARRGQFTLINLSFSLFQSSARSVFLFREGSWDDLVSLVNALKS